MRALFPVLLLLMAGALVAIGAVACGVSAWPVFVGYVIGVVAMLILSAVLNTCYANRLDREAIAAGQHSDFNEFTVDIRQPESPWGDIQRRGYHVADARLDRVCPGGVGHAVHDQSSTTAWERNHVR
jgi:hypothetical protein